MTLAGYYTVYDELSKVTKEQWDYVMGRMAYQPPAYSFKNRGVTMPPEYGQQALREQAQQDNPEEVYVNFKWISRHDVAAAQQAFARKEQEREQRRLEEQKKKDEEAKRQATIALRAKMHMTRRSMFNSNWLLLDPERVREALDFAERNGNMVTLDEDGTMGHDRAQGWSDNKDAQAGDYVFCPKATR